MIVVLSKKYMPQKLEARKKYFTQKVAFPELFSVTNELNILYFWYHFEPR